MLLDSGPLKWDGLHLTLGGVRVVTVFKKHRWYTVKWTNGKELNLSRRDYPDDKYVKRYIIERFIEVASQIAHPDRRHVALKKFREFLEQESTNR